MGAIVEEKRRLRVIEKGSVLLLLIGCAPFYKNTEVVFGILSGGLVSVINIKVITRITEGIFKQEALVKKRALIYQYIFKMVFLFATIWLLVHHQLINLVAFSIGFSIFILIIIIDRLLSIFK